MNRWLLVAAALIALGTSGAHANPDVWVEAGMTYRFEDHKVSSITFEWRFDPFFSSRTIGAYDADRSGSLEPAEVARLREEAFDPLEKFGYYVHVWVAGKRLENPDITEFGARIDGGLLVYRFTVGLEPPADPAAGDLVASLYDKSIYVDFRFMEKEFLLVSGTMRPGCKFSVSRGSGELSGHRQPVTLECGESS